MAALTQARLKKLLDYDPNTGVFVWKVTRGGGARAGDRAGYLFMSNGIKRRGIVVDSVDYKAARLAWLFVYSEWPNDEVDHKNRNALDDRISNLREASRGKNQANTRKYRHSKSPYRGITMRNTGRWVAQISVDGVTNGLGTYDTPEEAARVYDAAALLRFGEFAQLNFPS